jgi:Protein of unknown function (DUF1236)
MSSNRRAVRSGQGGRLFLRRSGMQIHIVRSLAALLVASAVSALIVAGAWPAAAQTGDLDESVSTTGVAPKLELTPAQKSAIYQAARRDKSKVAPSRFETDIGADVPPMIELYALPDDVLASNPATKFYKFTRVGDQIVLVDPTKMRVSAVIGPNPAK